MTTPTYDTAIAKLLHRITQSTPGDSAEALRALCEGVSILEQAKIYAAAQGAVGAEMDVEVVEIPGGSGLPN